MSFSVTLSWIGLASNFNTTEGLTEAFTDMTLTLGLASTADGTASAHPAATASKAVPGKLVLMFTG